MIMMKEEKYLKSKVGTRNTFRVPDSYFEDFASKMMDKLPQCNGRIIITKGSRFVKLRTLLYAAACICLVVFSLASYFTKTPLSDAQDNDIVATHYQKQTYTYEDEVIDYAMMDNADIYAYLTGE